MISTSKSIWGLLLFVLLAAYSLPWVIHTSTPLTMGALDLAEWTSLHPAVRDGTIPFLPTLLLRLPLVLIALITAAAPLPRTLRFFAILIFTAALLPPLEFFLTGFNDTNYAQQFILALITLILGMVMIFFVPQMRQHIVLMGLIITLLLVSAGGLLIAMGYMTDFSLDVRVGPGIMLLMGSGLAVVALLAKN